MKIIVNNQIDAQFLFLLFVYSNSVHVSCYQVLIIRRVNCINTTSGVSHSMQVTVWFTGLVPSKPAYHTVTYIERGDKQLVARNMYRIKKGNWPASKQELITKYRKLFSAFIESIDFDLLQQSVLQRCATKYLTNCIEQVVTHNHYSSLS